MLTNVKTDDPNSDYFAISLIAHIAHDTRHSKRKLRGRRVRIAGVVVAMQAEKQASSDASHSLWLDDSTGTLRILLSARTCRRFDFPELKTSEVVTVIGTLDTSSSGETIVRCAGFCVEHDPMVEAIHWMKAIEARSMNRLRTLYEAGDDGSEDEMVLKKEEYGEDPDKTLSYSVYSSSSPSASVASRKKMRAPLSNRYHTLFSQSPTRQTQTPPAGDRLHDLQEDDDTENWIFSPDRPIATSTPILNSFISEPGSEPSPLRPSLTKMNKSQVLQSTSSISFGDSLGDIDFDALERSAINRVQLQKPQPDRMEE